MNRPLHLLFALSLLACARETELASGHIVVHDPSGAVATDLRATSYGYVRRADQTRFRVGSKTVDAGEVRIEGDALQTAGSLRARIERKEGGVSLYDARRAPLGQLVPRDGKVWAYDPGGTPLGTARLEGNRIVLTDRDGAARGYVVGAPASAAAALLLGDSLSVLEKTVLAIYLTRLS